MKPARSRHELGILTDGIEELTFRTEAAVWKKKINVGDRLTLLIQVSTEEDLSCTTDEVWQLRLGRLAPNAFSKSGPIIHCSVLAIFALNTPREWQIEAKVTSIHPATAAFKGPV